MNPKELISPRGGAVTGLVQSVEVSLFLAIPQIFYSFLFNFWFQFLCPPFPAQQNFIRKSQQGPFTHQTWPLHGSYLVFGLQSYTVSAVKPEVSLSCHSMRSNRFMWDLQKITRSRIIILSINRPEDAGIWKSKAWRLHDTLKSQCFTMSNL